MGQMGANFEAIFVVVENIKCLHILQYSITIIDYLINKYSRDCGWPGRPGPNAGRKKKKKFPKISFFS